MNNRIKEVSDDAAPESPEVNELNQSVRSSRRSFCERFDAYLEIALNNLDQRNDSPR